MKTVKIFHNDGSYTEIPRPKENSSALEKRTKGEKILHCVIAAMLCVQIATLFVPWVWTFFSALKESFEYETSSPFALPKKWLFSNFLLAFQELEVDGTTFGGM
ncbi:MAG: hypothetical protein IJD33_06975, partial [Clostridia bacterium]|nr:hypothetical protein [Clostridia bacterium]